MRIAIYARVSTLGHGQDPQMQLRELREYATLRGWSVSGEYVDKGQSGAKDSRPELNRLMSDAHQRRFDGVLVWKIDRFGRSLKHLVCAIADLQEHGVAFVSLKDNIDLSTSSGRLMFNVIGAMCEFERELIRERVKSGLKNAAAEGRFGGRPKANRKADADAAAIRKLRDEGQSYGEIATELGRSKSDVYRVCMTLGCSPAS
ncbi:MAG TPA: recombinase family protein [Terriglobales bacterium]|nr:recombinase family protein [Terriglobales bacterium]